MEVALPRGALFGDGDAIEELVDDVRDFWLGVEPFDEGDSLFAFADAVVEFVADFGREICDFTVAWFHGCVSFFFWVLFVGWLAFGDSGE